MFRPRLCFLLLACALLFSLQLRADTWTQVRSTHFVVNTDAGADRGRQLLLRFEEMRYVFGQLILRPAVNIPVPLTIIAFRTGGEMQAHVPVFQGKAVDLSGFFVGRPDRNFIALDLSTPDRWTTALHEYGHMLLDGNYPPTPLWFDEGFADYFSTINVTRDGVEIGKPPQGYLELLHNSQWMPLNQLLRVTAGSKTYNLGDHRSLFYAQSWVLVHYLIDQQKLPAAGQYFGLVESQHIPTDDALQQAFGMTPQQLEQQVRNYYQSPQAAYRTLKLPIDVNNVNTYTAEKISPPDAQVMLADLDVHIDAHRRQGMQVLRQIVQQRPDNALALRSLGYAYLQENDPDTASQYFDKAAKLNSADPWVYYYSALLLHRQSEKPSAEELEDIKADLKQAIRLRPQFADAYNLLGLAEMQSGDGQLSLQALTRAVELSPRNESYRLNLAQAYIFAHKFQEATALLQNLTTSKDAKIADQANQQMQQMEQARVQQRVEILGRPAEQYIAPQWRPKKTAPKPASSEAKSADTPVLPQTGPVHYMKGTLLAVECSDPAATLTLRADGRTWKMLTTDYLKMTLIGADQFSCDWRDRKVIVNYRSMGPGRGALVSLELQ